MRKNGVASLLVFLLSLAAALPAAAVGPPAPAGKAAPGTAGPAPSPAPALHILSDTVLGEAFRFAEDVRWASDHSVVLALIRSGVVEYSLDGKTPPKQLIPGDNAPGGFSHSQDVAISSQYLAAGAWIKSITWRTLDSEARKEEAFECIDDLDVGGSRFALVGARRDAQGKFSPDGAIAWIGSLDKDLTDLKPLLFDAGGPGAPTMGACCSFFLGATRFLADGSLVVVPGVQPGIYHFDSKGKLLQTLDTVVLGIDTDCAAIGKQLASTLARDSSSLMAWENERRIVDDVLPLPSGPGLLIRGVQQGQLRWALKVLHPDGSVGVYDVPVKAPNLFAHLKGDFRQGRLVLLLWANPPVRNPDLIPPPHLLIALPPGS
ncbi:MAG: hypothetical protein WAM82_17635 [Thermoanaerobaculia bacterium]